QRSRLKKDIDKTRNRIERLEIELEEITEELTERIPKSDWEKLQEATDKKTTMEEELLELYHNLEGLEGIELD
ncbi:MAG TPA: hypothetical protein VJ983_03195, partial [candidate division Zixibacteria bacterium]|nr:hypothetical protein [candidate division Zixibacteria bacterium]